MRYRTIVADPPWRYRPARIPTTGKKLRAEPSAHYHTMTIDELVALPIRGMAEKDAHLYLWVTNPILPDAFPLIDAWGFTYRTIITWEKQGALGMGFAFRNQTEHVLFAMRGHLPIPPAKRQRTIFRAPKSEHSRKPDAFLDLVEQVSPGPYLELFARRARFGWDTWGDEALEMVELA